MLSAANPAVCAGVVGPRLQWKLRHSWMCFLIVLTREAVLWIQISGDGTASYQQWDTQCKLWWHLTIRLTPLGTGGMPAAGCLQIKLEQEPRFKQNCYLKHTGKMEVLGGQLIDREMSLECTIQFHHLYFIKHEIMFVIVLNSVRDISS